MNITVDLTRCAGHGRCYGSSPEIFEADAEGFPMLRVETLPPEWHEDARRAARGCPEGAIKLSTE